MGDRILLVDGHSIANRAFYGLPPMTNSRGVHTNAIYGFFTILWKVIGEVQPNRLAIAFDLPQPTFRHLVYGDYKGTRSPMPDELREQIPLLQDMLRTTDAALIMKPGLEADDVIGTLSARGASRGDEVMILSGDRDLLQLVNDKVTVLLPKTKKDGTELEVYHPAEVQEKYGVSPRGFLEMKALMGDSSDNIPGVPGVGEKTASKLIASFGDLEGVLAHKTECGGPKLVQSLTEYEEQARLSLFLATIKTDADFEEEPAPITDNCFRGEAFIRCLKEYEFKSLLARALGTAPAPEAKKKAEKAGSAAEAEPEKTPKRSSLPVSKAERTAIFTPEEWQRFVGSLKPEKGLALELFTASNGEWQGLALGDGSRFAWVEPGAGGSNLSLFDDETTVLTEAMITAALKELLENESIPKLCFDSKALYKGFMRFGIELKGVVFDGKIAAYLLNPTKSEYAPVELSLAYLGENALSEEEVLGSGAKKKDLRDIPTADKLNYAAAVPEIILRVRDTMTALLTEQGMLRLFTDIELPLAKTLADMETEGVRVDTEVLHSFGEYLKTEIAKYEQEIYAMAGEEFNINSPKKLGEILFEKLGLPCEKKTKSGYSTAAEVLDKLKNEYPIVAQILQYRQLTKLMGTYVEGMGSYIRPEDGKIHTSFQQTVTATGRLSSTDPNLQNIPIRMELGRELRKAFVPKSPDYCFMDADYSQIELRLVAHMAGDDNMIAAFNSGADIHRATAASVLHKAPEDVTPQERSSAKAVNFGIIYGISAYALSEDLGIHPREAADYIRRYFERFPGVESFLNEAVRSAKEKGYGVTLYGRRRPIEELKMGNAIVRGFGERVAKNMPVQGTAADIIKIAMNRVHDRLLREGLKSRLILQVHDELLLEVYRPETERVAKLLEEEMMGAAALSVPLNVEIHTGENWYEAK